jgi:hypothetical protein
VRPSPGSGQASALLAWANLREVRLRMGRLFILVWRDEQMPYLLGPSLARPASS